MIEIVIKIPDSVYQKVNDGEADEFTSAYVVGAILDGTILPKGHGRLIDGDELEKKMRTKLSISDCIRGVENAPTIIEADKEDADGK